MKEYRGAAYTLMGRRTRNQDNFMLNGQILEAKHVNEAATVGGLLEGPLFMAVVDGSGTKTTGETASELICRHLWSAHEKFEEVGELQEVVPIINESLFNANADIELIMEDEPTSKMGATAAVLLVYNGKAIFGNVGDCAVYRRRDGVMQKLTCDHTEGEELVARGALTREMLKNHSSKTKVTRRLGYMTFGKRDVMQFYDVVDVKSGDVFVLASPGVVQYMTADEIDKGLQTCVDVLKSTERVAKTAFNDFGSKDNITALALRINEQVDSVGNKHAKVKPIRANNVHVHTSLNIDPEDVIKTLCVAGILLIIAIAGLYVVKAYPRPEMLKHVEQKGNSWTTQLTSDTVVSDTGEVTDNNKPKETKKPSETAVETPATSPSLSGGLDKLSSGHSKTDESGSGD